MTKLLLVALATAIAAATPGEAAAQKAPKAPQRDRGEQPQIPSSQLPPAGMCRIWLEGVPASRQPAATDCVTALRNKPANARVIFGDRLPLRGKKGRGGRPFGPFSFER